ncbi:hypothetical protein DTO166G4_7640 [Paecilomyces variotii]|nr:hypothetical protein DTO166G4_7640 [Paecilomyces variotii]KAJ9229141.1 hypothetical protein DTO166G5_8075 [Paecilomyces variotii]KAJ9232511.1 hypothetical protein DTO169E5_7456 [Paecilomyces variotii]KAJ9255788.1 hypothetical protein DTO207G8_2805 [Paecilomyces variotii]KAJ9256446.1 hypothetical protein DTO195F2_5854 [Paecilomyces variotii]
MFGPPQLNEATINSIDFNRTSRRMLHDMREKTWGWVVYRTTYRSDPAFRAAIEILTSWIKAGVYEDLHEYGLGKNPDSTPNDQLWACHQLTVIEEPATLNEASFDAVRGHFEGWVEAQDKKDAWNKYRACLVMDEEAVQRLGEAMTPEEHREKYGERCYAELRKWFVPVVEAFPELGEEEETDFEGWMNCSVFNLIRLWTSLGDGMYMEDASNEVQDGVY